MLVAEYLADRAQRWLASDSKRTRAGLARAAGLSAAQVHDALDGVRKPSERSMRAMARAMGLAYDDVEEAAAAWLRQRRPPTRSAEARSPTPRRVATPRGAPAQSRLRERYPNRARAVAAAELLDHDPVDVAAVLEVVLPPGAPDPAPRAWMAWIEKAREERLATCARDGARARRGGGRSTE